MFSSPCDEGEDLLCKGDHDAAGNGEHAVGPLGGVVALEGQAQLEDAEAQQDEADGPDEGKNEVAQICHNRQRIVRREGRTDCLLYTSPSPLDLLGSRIPYWA